MDKLGPITRSAEDAGLVFEAIYGPDGLDPSLIDVPFNYRADVDFSRLRIGYLETAFDAEYPGREHDQATLETLRELGARLVPIAMPDFPVGPVIQMLNVEAAAAFDELTRSGEDAQLVRQVRNAWPKRIPHRAILCRPLNTYKPQERELYYNRKWLRPSGT